MLDRQYRMFVQAAIDAALFLSQPRPKNPDNITFDVEEMRVWSEQTGCAVLIRSDGRRCLIFLIHRNIGNNGGDWTWFVPTDSHANGLSGDRLRDALYYVEQKNLKHWRATREGDEP